MSAIEALLDKEETLSSEIPTSFVASDELVAVDSGGVLVVDIFGAKARYCCRGILMIWRRV